MALSAASAVAVTEGTQVAGARRTARLLAARLGFAEERAGRAELIASELATNLAKHARGGELLVQRFADGRGEQDGIEILSVDKGPGLGDAARSRRDGYSTSGTLGHGLGAVERLADSVDLYTHSTGTVIAVRLWRDPPRTPAAGPRLEVGGLIVAKPGEPVSGDAWSWRVRDARLVLFVADGLGHGAAAHDAAAAAVARFEASSEQTPGRIVADVHEAVRHTRGAAVATLAIDLERGTGVHAGLGNIGGVILLAQGGRHHLVSHNGTAGHVALRIQEFNYPLPAGALVALWSDGLLTSWDLTGYPGLRQRSASVIAAVLYRDFSRRRDDVAVVVAKERTPVAENQ